MKKKSIEKKVIKRILSDKYPKKYLGALLTINEQIESDGIYPNTDMKVLVPFLKEPYFEIEKLKKFQKSLRKKIIKKINTLAEKDKVTYYDIAILVFALDNLTGTLKNLNKKNSKIAFCCDYIGMIINLDSDKAMKKRLLYLKKID